MVTRHVIPGFRVRVQHSTVLTMKPSRLVIIGLPIPFIPVPGRSKSEFRVQRGKKHLSLYYSFYHINFDVGVPKKEVMGSGFF